VYADRQPFLLAGNLNILYRLSNSRYRDSLRAGRSGDRIPVGARHFAPLQTGPGAHPASCTMGTGSFPGVKSDWGVTLTPHPLLLPWSRKSRAIPLLRLWTFVACSRVNFTFNLYRLSKLKMPGTSFPLPLYAFIYGG